MNPGTKKLISFDTTEYAFFNKTNAQLRKAYLLFSVMKIPWQVRLGSRLMPLAIRYKLPFAKTIIRSTIFGQFVGGETMEQTAAVVCQLEQQYVQTILDYGVEGGCNGEKSFNHASCEFIKVINYAATQQNIPFISVKLTAIARFSLLETLEISMHTTAGSLLVRYANAVGMLAADEKEEWRNVELRLTHICKTAHLKKIGVLLDAEESWIQGPINALSILMMDIFNKEVAIVYNTIQLYCRNGLRCLQDFHREAIKKDFILGVKLVRGAYMEKERRRALELNYPSPIQPDKKSCDTDYNAALHFSFNHITTIATIVATHNEYSNLYALELLQHLHIAGNHPHVHFSQLYGMRDTVTFNLAKAGYNVSKYLPFGPLKEVIPYLLRRAEENSSISGQSNNELELIRQEIKRRNSCL